MAIKEGPNYAGNTARSLRNSILQHCAAFLQSRVKRGASLAVLARLLNAAMLLLTQLIFARALGAEGFGVYALASTWIVALALLSTFGLSMAPQRFQPDYAARGEHGLLWGLFRFAHFVPLLGGTLLALSIALGLSVLDTSIDPTLKLALLIGMAGLPAIALIDIIEGFALSNEWNDLAYGMTYVLRPFLLLALALLAFHASGSATIVAVMGSYVLAAWIAATLISIEVYRRLLARFPTYSVRYESGRWSRIAFPALMAEVTLLAVGIADIMILSVFASSSEVGIYVASTKLVAVVAFVQFGLSYASAHHFAALQSRPSKSALRHFAIQTARWTFWPSLMAAAVLAVFMRPLLDLFGPGFSAGADIMPILLLALVIRAAVGPSDQLLMMADQARVLTTIHAVSTGLVVLLGALLVPTLGMTGAALAALAASIFGSLSIALCVRRHLGGFVHPFSALRAVSAEGSPT